MEPDRGQTEAENIRGEPELVLIAEPDTELRARPEGLAAEDDTVAQAITEVLEDEDGSIEQLFGATEERLEAETASVADAAGEEVPDLSLYYAVDVPEDRMERTAERLRSVDGVAAAYVKPSAALGTAADTKEPINAMTAREEVPGDHTPLFEDRQLYLDAAPAGVDARHAWEWSGGRGAGVKVVNVEFGWNFNHEDLRENQGGLVYGQNSTTQRHIDHGTAVFGEISGDDNDFGVTGIATEANLTAAGALSGTAAAIRAAANRLGRGDILLNELHRPGPAGDWIPLEWWPDDWAAFRHAVARGVVVVSIAGNGNEDLDDELYDEPDDGFPDDWSNPFRRGNHDSGAILVGAGAPPQAAGGNHGPDRSRLGFSNYGSAVDAQGWGREVTTTGYGDLQGGPDEDEWYTEEFSGTSSAAPIVAGALACVQGVLRRSGRTPLSPLRARDLLRSTGSSQQDAPNRPRSQRIGNRPNLRQLIPRALRTRTWTGVQFRGTVPANRTRRWFTFRWPAQWHVLWTVVPTTPKRGGPQIRWNVQVERASHQYITYWISITNVTSTDVDIEARYAVLGET